MHTFMQMPEEAKRRYHIPFGWMKLKAIWMLGAKLDPQQVQQLLLTFDPSLQHFTKHS